MIVKEAQERWLPVPEWEKYYEVSNTGKVRSIDRMICRKDGSKYFKKGRILIHHPCGSRAKFGDGYLFVGLMANGIKSQPYVHRLVAMTFIPPFTGEQVNHIDLNKRNNNVENLEWVSRRQNVAHAIKHGRYVCQHIDGQTLAAINPNRARKLTPTDVAEIRRLCASGVRQADVGEMFGICQATVSQIHRRVSWADEACIDPSAMAAYRAHREQLEAVA